MSIELHRQIFEEFRAAARDKGLYPNLSGADDFYLTQLRRWQDLIKFEKVVLPDTAPDAEKSKFNVGWIIVAKSRSNRSRRGTSSKVYTLIVGGHTETGRITIAAGETEGSQFARLKEPDVFFDIIAHADVQKYKAGYVGQDSYKDIAEYLKEALTRLSFQIVGKIDTVHRRLGLTRREQKGALQKLAATAGYNTLHAQHVGVEYDIDRIINHDAMEFAEEFNALSLRNFKKRHPPLTIYNHLISAPSLRALDYRKGALSVLAPMKELYLADNKMWSMVDEGQPVFAAVASSLSCQPATIRRIVNQASLFVEGGTMAYLAGHLNGVDPARWPKNPTELAFFNLVVKTAAVFADAFTRTVHEVIEQWMKESRSRGHGTWADILQRQMVRQIENQVAKEKAKTSKPKKEAPILVGESDEDDEGVVRSTRFFGDCFANYKSDLSNIGHMKSDLRLKLIRPAILLVLEAMGWRVTAPNAIAPIEEILAHTMWGDMPPSEQVAASGYWHSPRVNFSGRFQSIAHSADQNMAWRTLFDEPFKMKSGVTLHPLTSTADLRQEADAMAHCVWSYSYNCMANSYHIFSVRDQNGTRLSTLSVQDFFEGKTRKIRLIQNASVRNSAAPDSAVKAFQSLMDIVNKGDDKIRIDWQAIDESRAAFLVQQLDNSVGYDFRIPEQRERIFDLYEPCLSRKALRRSRRTFESFAEALGTQTQVEHFMTTREADIGGLVKAEVVSGAVRPENSIIGIPPNPAEEAHYG